jgi:hypothetical protein
MSNPKQPVDRTCEQCGATFVTNPARVRYGHARFCSRVCYDAWKLTPQEGRTCNTCGIYKTAEHFDPNYQQRARLRPECKECRRARTRDYNQRTRDRRRAYRIMRDFGLTPEQYAVLVARQEGRCGICGTTEPGNGFVFMPVDHDHVTGAVRGLLCATCNHGLGNFKDDPRLLRAAITYLEVTHVSSGSPVRGVSQEGAGPTVDARQHAGHPNTGDEWWDCDLP